MKSDGTHELYLTSVTQGTTVRWSLECTDCPRSRTLTGDSGKEILQDSKRMHEKTTKTEAWVKSLKKH